MGLFSSIASFIGGNNTKKAATGAANAQIASAGQGLTALGNQQADAAGRVDQALGGLAPTRDTGNDATGMIRALLGLDGPDAQAASLGQLQQSPLLASLNRNGSDLVLANASATGGLRGGNTQHSLAQLGTDNFASIIQQQLANLTGVADRGVTAGQSILNGQLGFTGQTLQNTGGQVDLLKQQGAAKAGGILGRNAGTQAQIGAAGNALNSIVSAFAGGKPIGNTTLGQFI